MHIRLFVFLLFLFFSFTYSLAQQTPLTGLIPDDEAYQQIPQLPDYGGSKYNNIPIEMSLRSFCPPPGDQGDMASCVGWSAGYGALSIERAIRDSITDKARLQQLAYSALYVYDHINETPDNCTNGSKITAALQFLKEKGNCLFNAYDKKRTACHKGENSEKWINESYNIHIKDYAAIFDLNDTPEVKIDKTRKSLANRKPIVIGMKLPSSFLNISGKQEPYQSQEGEEPVHDHAMVVTGYDEVIKAFEVMNSWGSQWGNNGFIWINYDDFGRYVKYGFQILLTDDNNGNTGFRQNHISGNFIFRYPIGYKKDENGFHLKDEQGKKVINFKTAEPVLQNHFGVYTLQKEVWKVNDLFQLVTKNVPEGKYVYVFSINPEKELTFHWPPEVNNPKSSLGKTFVNYIPNKNAEIIIPEPGSALQLTTAGADHLIVLYANEQINDYKLRAQNIVNYNDSVIEQFKTSFKEVLIPQEQIIYHQNQMQFTTKPKIKNGLAVPVVLKVMAK